MLGFWCKKDRFLFNYLIVLRENQRLRLEKQNPLLYSIENLFLYLKNEHV